MQHPICLTGPDNYFILDEIKNSDSIKYYIDTSVHNIEE